MTCTELTCPLHGPSNRAALTIRVDEADRAELAPLKAAAEASDGLRACAGATNGSPEGDGAREANPKAPRAVQTYSCSGCSERWGGVSRCHCAGCHRTFGGLGLFDAHRRDVKGVGTCLDPSLDPKAKFEGGIWRSSAEFDAAKAFGR